GISGDRSLRPADPNGDWPEVAFGGRHTLYIDRSQNGSRRLEWWNLAMGRFLDRAAELQNRFLDRLRHPAAFEVAGRPGISADFSSLRGCRQCLLVTFKRSGDAVPSPVNFGLSDDGSLYLRCDPDAAKLKRLK